MERKGENTRLFERICVSRLPNHAGSSIFAAGVIIYVLLYLCIVGRDLGINILVSVAESLR